MSSNVDSSIITEIIIPTKTPDKKPSINATNPPS